MKPVEPVFSFRDGLLLVDGKLTNVPGNSYLRLFSAVKESVQFRLEDVRAQSVVIVSGDGAITEWPFSEERDLYLPPEDFMPQEGQTYFVRIRGEDGAIYESQPETMPASVLLEDFRSTFNQESYYNDEIDRFVPAFELTGSFQDNAQATDYYRFVYSSWEKLDVCVSCSFGQYSPFEMMCVSTPASRFVSRFDYACAEDCWEISRYSDFSLFTDEFVDGNRVTDLQFGQINYDWYGKLLIIGELEKISPTAHEYFRILRAQSLGSGGLNAALPASLDGNIDAIGNEGSPVLGYFAVVAGSEDRVFFDRDTVQGFPLPFDGDLNYDIPPPPAAPYVHPCEGPDRSNQRPPGWIE